MYAKDVEFIGPFSDNSVNVVIGTRDFLIGVYLLLVFSLSYFELLDHYWQAGISLQESFSGTHVCHFAFDTVRKSKFSVSVFVSVFLSNIFLIL